MDCGVASAKRADPGRRIDTLGGCEAMRSSDFTLSVQSLAIRTCQIAVAFGFRKVTPRRNHARGT
jgi:hypothetical protein